MKARDPDTSDSRRDDLLRAVYRAVARKSIAQVTMRDVARARPRSAPACSTTTSVLVELGPTFVKLAQVMASRPDVVREHSLVMEYIEGHANRFARTASWWTAACAQSAWPSLCWTLRADDARGRSVSRRSPSWQSVDR